MLKLGSSLNTLKGKPPFFLSYAARLVKDKVAGQEPQTLPQTGNRGDDCYALMYFIHHRGDNKSYLPLLVAFTIYFLCFYIIYLTARQQCNTGTKCIIGLKPWMQQLIHSRLI